MIFEPGRTLLHYEIVEKIGEGGMGEVYRARDSKLGRDVAIKVLPPDLSGDSDRLVRFQREAQLLASLNHPNIAGIYGVEEVQGNHFLVLELVEGVDLAERLTQGPIPLEQALGVARQIAEALEEAHEQGIVHRDLKPANVKLTPDAKVKVLDFGLAKALETPGREVNASFSPTITSSATQAGVIMGTAAYMSPEQARGSVVDKRADIWGFGCVLLELVTGRNPFVERTVSDTLASVLRSEPDWRELPKDVSPALQRLLRRCLDKEPLHRLRDIGEARIAIDEILSGESGDEPDPTTLPAARSRWARWIALGATLMAAVAITALITSRLPTQDVPAVRQFQVVEGDSYPDTTPPTISPDGLMVVYGRNDSLWLRRLDQLEPRQLEGTKGARQPAWSPDSRTIIFGANNDLKTISVDGGVANTIAIGVGYIDSTAGLCVGPGDNVVLTSSGGGIAEIPLRGGELDVILDPDGATESDFHGVSCLPDGSLLFVTHRTAATYDTIEVLSKGSRKVLLQVEDAAFGDPVYSPTGHILYRRKQTKSGLWAMPFDLDRLEVTGASFLVTPNGGLPSVADDGTLLYVSNGSSGLRELVWVDRAGVTVTSGVGQPQVGIKQPKLSQDDSRVAFMAQENEIGSIWVLDIKRGTRSRLTFGKAMDWDPVWMPDKKRILYWDGTMRALAMIAADGASEATRLVEQNFNDSGVPSISPDGESVAFWVVSTTGEEDIWSVVLGDDRTARPLLQSKFVESDPSISPSGDLLAYYSDESGDPEIYLTRFPDADGKWQVSVDGGAYPVWSKDGSELFYLEETLLKQVDVSVKSGIQLSTPRTLFDTRDIGVVVSDYGGFDVSQDGSRFLMVREIRDPGKTPSLVIHYDWDKPFTD